MVGTRTREQQHGRRRRIYWAMAVPKDVSKQKWWQKIANRHSTFRQNVLFLFCTLRSFFRSFVGQVVDVVFLFICVRHLHEDVWIIDAFFNVVYRSRWNRLSIKIEQLNRFEKQTLEQSLNEQRSLLHCFNFSVVYFI